VADPAKGEAALNTALDMGIYTVHSSYEYGTQEATGRILAARPDRDRVSHIIKSHSKGAQMDAAEFRAFVEGQLRVLGADKIDIMQIRGSWEDDLVILEHTLKLVEEGKVIATALFAYNMDQARSAIPMDGFSGLAAYLNPLTLEVADAYPLLREIGKKVLAYQPLAAGALSDHRQSWEGLPEDDRFKDEEGKSLFALRARIAKVLGGTPESWSAFSLGFLLSRPETAGVVVSMNAPEQVQDLVSKLGAEQIGESLFNRIAELYRTHQKQSR
jgi:aryl-alcohol dehydrogenase-like predicted oxidoreductase